MTAAGARNHHPEAPRWAAGWVDSFRLYLNAAGKSQGTVYRYTDAASWLAGWLGREHPGVDDFDQVTHRHVQGFLVHLQEAGYSRKYVHCIGAAVQAYFKWWAAEEEQPDPMVRVAVPAAPKLGENPPPVLELEQVAAILKDAEKGRDFESRRDAAMIRVFASTGVRVSELAAMMRDDVSRDRRDVTVTGKGGKTRTVRFDHKTALALDRYLRVRDKHKHAYLPDLWLGVRRRSGMSASGVRQAIERRGERLGIRLHPHRFRHFMAHRWLAGGGPESDLEELAGWDSSQMLRHYGRGARSERARSTYDRIDVMGGI